MGNYEIQAKIDIERHQEWSIYERTMHLYKMKLKDAALIDQPISRKKYDIYKIIEEYIDDALPLTWRECNNFVEFIQEEKPWVRGLRANTRIINEGVWTDARY